MYSLARPLLFQLSPELAHDVTLTALKLAGQPPLLPLLRAMLPTPVDDPFELFGCRFANRVGLAAGLDKDAAAVPGLAALGFGFVEVGTVTPLAQPGNPKPRMFRLAEHDAIINRMGFNNHGLLALVAAVSRHRQRGIDVPLGINIGKNKLTPAEQAADDFVQCLLMVAGLADYVTVNLSSPNTPGLRDLQFGEQLDSLLAALGQARQQLRESGADVPLLVKLAPDMARDDLLSVVDRLVAAGIDGVIATNTTIERDAVRGAAHADETGGLSGAPLAERATEVVATLAGHLQGAIAIVGVGGIDSAERALEKIQAGADLVQLYSGLIYQGPSLVGAAAQAIRDHGQG